MAHRLGVSPQQIDVVSVEPRTWPDACLGFPRPAEVCAQVVTPGYLVTLGLPIGETDIYRTDQTQQVRLESVIPEG